MTEEEFKQMQGKMNATIEEEVFNSLASQFKRIENNVRMSLKGDMDGLKIRLDEAQKTIDLLRTGAKHMGKENLKESDQYEKKLNSVTVALQEQINRLQESLLKCKWPHP